MESQVKTTKKERKKQKKKQARKQRGKSGTGSSKPRGSLAAHVHTSADPNCSHSDIKDLSPVRN